MLIIGAGMSGLLAANMFRKKEVKIIERQDKLPNNHEALLRFRTKAASDASGISFKKVLVRKQINYHGDIFQQPTIQMANEYCYKVADQYSSRSIWNLDPVHRYIAPSNFISLLAKNCHIEYRQDAGTYFENIKKHKQPIISTMPMAALMDFLGWRDKPEFQHKTIWTVTFNIESPFVDLYQTTYYPNPDLDIYRLSMTGNKVIAEFIRKPQKQYEWNKRILSIDEYLIHFLEHDFGVSPSLYMPVKESCQKYGKLIPIDDEIRKRFIAWATNKYNIYSLGRWATHRQLLLDDVVKDIHIIDNLINSNNYNK